MSNKNASLQERGRKLDLHRFIEAFRFRVGVLATFMYLAAINVPEVVAINQEDYLPPIGRSPYVIRPWFAFIGGWYNRIVRNLVYCHCRSSFTFQSVMFIHDYNSIHCHDISCQVFL